MGTHLESLKSNLQSASFLSGGKFFKNASTKLKQAISQNLFACFTAIGNAPQATTQSMIAQPRNHLQLLNSSSSYILSSQSRGLHTSANNLGRLGGAGHPGRRTETRVKQRRNHYMTRRDYFKMGEAREHNRVICPCGAKMMLKYHICDTCYQATKHQTESMLFEYREKTGNKFLVGETKFQFKDDLEPISEEQENKKQQVVKLDQNRPSGWFNVKLW